MKGGPDWNPNSWLCWLGLHRWGPWQIDEPLLPYYIRDCHRCGKRQIE